jgi:alkylhydroperoxidase family enzyme
MLRPEQGRAAVAYIKANWEHSALPTREREAARLRVAQLNGCKVCNQWRVGGFDSVGAEKVFYDSIENWRTSTEFSQRERLAVELAEKFSLDWRNIGEEFVAELRRHFADSEIVDLLICIGQYVAHGRLVEILDLDTTCPIAPASSAKAVPLDKGAPAGA